MKFSKVIYVDRGAREVSALVSAVIQKDENSRLHLSAFISDFPLKPVETEFAMEELMDRALSYPELFAFD